MGGRLKSEGNMVTVCEWYLALQHPGTVQLPTKAPHDLYDLPRYLGLGLGFVPSIQPYPGLASRPGRESRQPLTLEPLRTSLPIFFSLKRLCCTLGERNLSINSRPRPLILEASAPPQPATLPPPLWYTFSHSQEPVLS